LGGKDGRWSAGGRTVDETLSSGVQSWLYAFDGDYAGPHDVAAQDLGEYDIVIANMNRPLLPLLRLARNRPASVKWVSLVEGSAHEYFLPRGDLKALLDLSDLVNVINRHSVPLFRALTGSKVECIGMPYPVDGVRKFAVPVEARARRIFLCAHLSRQWNEYLAARGIGLPCYGYEVPRPRPGGLSRLVEFVRTGTWAWDGEEPLRKTRALYKALYDDDALGVTSYTKDMPRYLRENGNAYLWIDLDSRYTWSRFVLDAAALAIPIITTSSTCHGQLLFPETTVAHAMDIEHAIALGKRLSSDRAFYDHVASYPADKMDFLRAEPMKRALLRALGMR
jgi:hypothetical protein